MKILLSAVLALFLVACSEEKPKEVQNTEPAKVVTEEVKTAPDTKPAETTVAEVKKDVEVAVTQAVKEAETVATEVVKDVKSVAVDVQEKAEVAAVAAVEEVTEVVDAAKAAVDAQVKEAETKTEVSESASISGEVLYKVCAGCHGVNGEKPALGKSQIIKGWSAEKVENALNGYKDESYGGAMKGIMKGQVSKLTPEDIKALAEHISKL